MLFHFGPNTVLWAIHPETVEPLFNNSVELLGKSVQYDCLKRWLGTGLLTSTGRKWHSRRKMLTPAFHFQILGDALSIFNSQVTLCCPKRSLKCQYIKINQEIQNFRNQSFFIKLLGGHVV